MNIFGTILTYAAPSANYRGESAENRSVLQKITQGRFEYPIISPEAIRNALRDTLRELGLPCNRERLNDEEQLAVKFQDYPDPDRFADDFFMGWLIAAGSKDRKKILKELKERGRNPEAFSFKRDSILRMNLAVALEPYRYDSIFTQSPQDVTPNEIKSYKNAENSQLLHREVTYTPFQYPFALNLNECEQKKDWTKILLKAIGQLNGVAGNHARSYFEMAPASIIIRLTNLLVAGYSTYGFEIKDGKHLFPEVIEGILQNDYPGSEFYFGGKIVKDMDEPQLNSLKEKGATLERNPQKLIDIVAEKMFASGE
ncbi:CRISPR-associated protein Cas7/Cst2/DevR [Dissulfuribacter thermophilus]|uniref:CRISPR-associated protein Cas7/Cst2/DevR n=1 Tax=Dissulfuribacter thermophilus TaxID=1156395 RepID=A0A1B9F3I2_9BACT|nr:type I-B CRISPR-associated protein Cas7/Cst2/DevR [Dissulfuribacter thermophilus]OCC14482.1 CRISPR-associated protein Cas7/Cst2/DevR [Dissulfuribacter thermophilus]